MIDIENFSTSWINTISEQYNSADKILVEKAIRALNLLYELSSKGLNFVFKGGTAIMLLSDVPQRLSIDIDIILPVKEDLSVIFKQIIEESTFNRYEEQVRDVESTIEKGHYKFYYQPTHKTHSLEEFILLDILYEISPYNNIVAIPIQSSFLKNIRNSVSVSVPTYNNLLGDKLTAFAPNTTGIPYFKNDKSMSMGIIKQLFDIAYLADKLNNLEDVKSVFYKMAQSELKYRDLSELSPADVLNDIFETSLGISTRGILGTANFNELQKGINRVKSYILHKSFTIDNAIIAASKAAYLVSLLKLDDKSFEPYSPLLLTQSTIIENSSYTKLNKLKKNNPEAFYYWYKALQILE